LIFSREEPFVAVHWSTP